MKDKPYYDEFGGGVTVSGGEPLLHAGLIAEFFAKLQSEGVRTALDTCGYAPPAALRRVLPAADAVLYDIKLMDAARHKELTGKDNTLILENLFAVAEYIRRARLEENREVLLWIRTPLIPGETATAGNIENIADFILSRVIDVTGRWELCAFNAACVSKYIKMQKPWPYEGASAAAMRQSAADALKNAALSRGFPEDKLIITGIILQDE
jgi:pyruvate formate lyase activating enzyme